MELKHEFTLASSVSGIIPQAIIKTELDEVDCNGYSVGGSRRKSDIIVESSDSIYLYDTTEAGDYIKSKFSDKKAYHQISFPNSSFRVKLVCCNGKCYLGIKSSILPNPDVYYKVKNISSKAVDELLKTEEIEKGGEFKNDLEIAFNKQPVKECIFLSSNHPNYNDILDNLARTVSSIALGKSTKKLVPGDSYMSPLTNSLIFLGTIEINHSYLERSYKIQEGDLFIYESSLKSTEKTITDVLKNRSLRLYDMMRPEAITSCYTDDNSILIVPTNYRKPLSIVNKGVLKDDITDQSLGATIQEIMESEMAKISVQGLADVRNSDCKEFKSIERLINLAALFNTAKHIGAYSLVSENTKINLIKLVITYLIASNLRLAFACKVNPNRSVYLRDNSGNTWGNTVYNRTLIGYRMSLLTPRYNPSILNDISTSYFSNSEMNEITDIIHILSEKDLKNLVTEIMESSFADFTISDTLKEANKGSGQTIYEFKINDVLRKKIINVDNYIDDKFGCRTFQTAGSLPVVCNQMSGTGFSYGYGYRSNMNLENILITYCKKGVKKEELSEVASCIIKICNSAKEHSTEYVTVTVSSFGTKSKAVELINYKLTEQQIIDYAKANNLLTPNLVSGLFELRRSHFDISTELGTALH